MLMKLFGRTRETIDESTGSWLERESAIVQRLINDFPWLWAIRHYLSWDDAKYIKVSQAMDDLKITLSRDSSVSTLKLWIVYGQWGKGFSMCCNPVNATPNLMWAETIMRQTHMGHFIHYIVVDEGIGRRITIYRHPDKMFLNETIEHLCRLHGSTAQWLFPDSLD